MQPKPNPNTQARVDATDVAAVAKAKADAAEMTLAHWRALCSNAGVLDVRLNLRDGEQTIELRGMRERRSVIVEQPIPKGQPFPLYAVIALHAFEQGLNPKRIAEPVFETTRTAEGHVEHVAIEMTLPEKCAHDPADAIGEFVADITPTTPGVQPMPPITPADLAAKIAKRSSPVDIYKPPAAGAGQRRPLSLPLCKVCEAQPVYNPSAEFCGAECARKFYTDKATRAVKGNR